MSQHVDRRVEAQTFSDLADAYARHGNQPDAIRCWKRSLATMREIGDRDGQARILASLAAIQPPTPTADQVGSGEHQLSDPD